MPYSCGLPLPILCYFLSAIFFNYFNRFLIIFCFFQLSLFKQFYGSVTKSDYVTLRLGFIMIHCRGNPKFNFHKYMISALEDDFRQYFGISSLCNKNDFQCEDIRLVELSSWRHMNKQKIEELILFNHERWKVKDRV
ncbi:unnamed protein product [Lupinus luteus]|uniref:Uncharacterized protein n=1 Tax=Lupinus luteus TaxID=3873 RepID=A0AAV1W9E4_LUPLU